MPKFFGLHFLLLDMNGSENEKEGVLYTEVQATALEMPLPKVTSYNREKYQSNGQLPFLCILISGLCAELWCSVVRATAMDVPGANFPGAKNFNTRLQLKPGMSLAKVPPTH